MSIVYIAQDNTNLILLILINHVILKLCVNLLQGLTPNSKQFQVTYLKLTLFIKIVYLILSQLHNIKYKFGFGTRHTCTNICNTISHMYQVGKQ